MWSVIVAVDVGSLSGGNEQSRLKLLIDAWLLALAECFQRIKLPTDINRRVLNKVQSLSLENPSAL